mgnify:FL=1
MAFFNKKSKFDSVSVVSVFPKIGTVVLRVDDKLIVFSPSYLLGKHGSTSKEVSSKFLEVRTARELLLVLKAHVTPRKLKGDRVEIKEVDIGIDCGFNNLVKLSPDLIGVLPQENVRGSNINLVYTTKGKITKTQLMNFILVGFNPKFGQGVETLFSEKYGGNITFNEFTKVYAVLTLFPGKFAPPFQDTNFWNEHALLKEM